MSTPTTHPIPAESDDSERELLEASIPLESAGRRFDQVLAELFPDFSRSRLTGWIKAGDALLDGRLVKPKEAVRGGEPVTLSVRIEVETEAEAEDIPITVLFEDEDVLVVDKPAGLVVHPGAGNPRGTLVNALLHFDARLSGLPRAGTSLVEQLSGREVHRQYVAVVQGTMVAGTTIRAPIDRHPTDRVRMAVAKEGSGRDAITHYRVREKFRSHTLVECRLETGRTHQIRVHMAHVRHPIVGDPLYGGAYRQPKACTEALSARLQGFKRQALHAEKLSFRHPVSGEELSNESPMPEDMQGLVLDLRADTAAAKK